MPQCEQIKEEYKKLQSLKKDFDLALEKAQESQNREDVEKARELMNEIKEKRKGLEEIVFFKEIKGTWENPETGEKKEIVLNIEKEIETYKNFYQKHLNLELSPEQEREIKKIWRKNKEEIKKEIETYGYDYILITPENLPNEEELNKKLINSMKGYNCPRCSNREHRDTWLSDTFEEGGGWKGVKNTEEPKLKIVLTKSNQNTYNSGDPIIEATLNKNIMQLTGLSEKEVQKRIKNQEPLLINFKTKINNKEFQIKAEGLSLKEYLVFQRIYYDQNQKHLDEEGWTWLLKSLSGSRVAGSGWSPRSVYRRLVVLADGPGYSGDSLGGRPVRSFSS